jgi:dipeptidyl aminopeptidase/acylaminoacyl peptidase
MLPLAALLSLPLVDSEYPFDLSPDGRWLAYAANPAGRWELYELALGPERAAPRPLAPGVDSSFAPRYSPDGGRLAWARDTTGGETFHLMLLERANGKLTDLTPDIPFSLQPNLCWSPDGQQIALLADRDGCFDAYTIPSTGGLLSKVLATGHPCWAVEWSPDGRCLAVEALAKGLERHIWLVPLAGGEPVPLGGGINAWYPAWSPDGKWLAFCSDAPGPWHIGLLELASGEIEWLPGGGGEYAHPVWSPDGSRIAATCGLGTSTALSLLHLDNGAETRRLVESRRDLPGVHSLPHFTPDGKSLLFVFDNPASPPGLWRMEIESGPAELLTEPLPAGLAAALRLPETITYPGLDGTPVPALLFRPPQTPAPGLVVIHGGPDWHFENWWYPFWAHVASRGWAVLAPNYRGSTGYGRDWQEASRFNFGGVDTDDCAAGAHYLVQQGLADPQRIAVTGRSHGGFLTMSCLTRYPELWAAGSAVVPFLNWFSSHERSRGDLQDWNIENMGDPVAEAERWRAASPYFFLDQVRAPVQFICGGHDPRCPAEDALEARDRLLALGKPVELEMYPDEGHAFLKLENLLDSELRRVDFLARALERK